MPRHGSLKRGRGADDERTQVNDATLPRLFFGRDRAVVGCPAHFREGPLSSALAIKTSRKFLQSRARRNRVCRGILRLLPWHVHQLIKGYP
jgi:hypothetical protein